MIKLTLSSICTERYGLEVETVVGLGRGYVYTFGI